MDNDKVLLEQLKHATDRLTEYYEEKLARYEEYIRLLFREIEDKEKARQNIAMTRSEYQKIVVGFDFNKYTIEDIFYEVGCDVVFNDKQHFTEEALSHYDDAVVFYVNACGGSEDDFDRLCSENDCFDEEE